MAYPEPIPAVKQKDAKEFLRRLDEFKLNSAQKEFYSDAHREYSKKKKE